MDPLLLSIPDVLPRVLVLLICDYVTTHRLWQEAEFRYFAILDLKRGDIEGVRFERPATFVEECDCCHVALNFNQVRLSLSFKNEKDHWSGILWFCSDCCVLISPLFTPKD